MSDSFLGLTSGLSFSSSRLTFKLVPRLKPGFVESATYENSDQGLAERVKAIAMHGSSQEYTKTSYDQIAGKSICFCIVNAFIFSPLMRHFIIAS